MVAYFILGHPVCVSRHWHTNIQSDIDVCSLVDRLYRFQYEPAKSEGEVQTARLFGGNLATYGPGGFVRKLPAKTHARYVHDSVDELNENGWIDKATRAVFIEFTVYNPHLFIFCAVKYVREPFFAATILMCVCRIIMKCYLLTYLLIVNCWGH